MNRVTRRKSAVAETHYVGQSGCDSIWRCALATFLADASSALVPNTPTIQSGRPYFYLLQTDGIHSLCLLTGLTVEAYSALLIECKLVRILELKDGSRSVQVNRKEWDDFVMTPKLRGDAVDVRGRHVELTDGSIKISAIKDGMAACEEEGATTHHMKMWMLRVGKVRDHDRGNKKNTAINHGVLPPRMNTVMREAKEKLCDATRDNNLMRYMDATKMRDVTVVKKWVLMGKTITTPEEISNFENVGVTPPLPVGSSIEEDIMLSPPAIKTTKTVSSTVASLTGYTPLPTLQLLSTPATVVSTVSHDVLSASPNDDSEFLQKQFPTLTKVSPRLVVRQKNMVAGMDMDLLLFQGVLAESARLCDYHQEPLGFTYSNGKHGVRLIKLPMSKNNRGKVIPNIAACIDELLSVVGESTIGEGDVDEDCVADLLLDYLLNKHQSRVIEKLRESKLIPKVMDEFDMGALLDRSGIKVWQWRIINQCLRLFMGIQKVCVPERRFRELGADHGVITHGTYYYTDPTNPTMVKEQVRY